jgi:hypothetical protein
LEFNSLTQGDWTSKSVFSEEQIIGLLREAEAGMANHDVASRADFNGDGRLDVLWYRASDRNLVLWQGNTTGGFDTIGSVALVAAGRFPPTDRCVAIMQ